MEDSGETQPLLQKKKTPLTLVKLDNEHPELVARIFSFLPGEDSGLNYLMRLAVFQPSDDPQDSHYYHYPIAQKIIDAHDLALVDDCNNGLTEILKGKMKNFMKTKQYSNDSFSWSPIRKLDYLMSPVNIYTVYDNEIEEIFSSCCQHIEKQIALIPDAQHQEDYKNTVFQILHSSKTEIEKEIDNSIECVNFFALKCCGGLSSISMFGGLMGYFFHILPLAIPSYICFTCCCMTGVCCKGCHYLIYEMKANKIKKSFDTEYKKLK